MQLLDAINKLQLAVDELSKRISALEKRNDDDDMARKVAQEYD